MKLTEALARRRVTLGFVSGVLVLLLAQPTARSVAAGALVACLGEALRIWAAGHLNKSQEITSSGPYRWLAHPLYAGTSLMGVGLALASASVAAALLIAVYLGTTLTAAVMREEAFLGQRFGEGYARYQAGGSHAGARARSKRFSVSRAIANHEPRTMLGLAGAILLLLLKATYNGTFWREGG
jgi:isoprenylcysteine carboxyl methyltransferase (ICMT) family protein YpbQ